MLYFGHVLTINIALHFSNFDKLSMSCSEVVLTLGRSSFVMEFLCAAKEKKRSFHVFIAEGAPRYADDVN